MISPIHRQREAARGARLQFPQDGDRPKLAECRQAFDGRRATTAG